MILTRWLCKIGVHNWQVKTKWLPSFHAQIVKEVISRKQCKRCGQVEKLYHWVWKQEYKDKLNEL